jgi:hypothetical protein
MNGKFWGKIAISAFILGLFALAFNTINSTPDMTTLLLPPVQGSPLAKELMDSVTLVRSEVAIQEKGHLARAAFAIENSSDHAIKNIEILCTLMDNAGTEQGRDKWVVYDTIKAHSNGLFSYTTKKYVSNKAIATQCQIIDMEKAQAPLLAIHRGGSTGGHGGDQHETPDAMHGGAHH